MTDSNGIIVELENVEKIYRQGKVDVPARPFFYPLSSLPAFPGCEARYRPENPNAYDISDRAVNLSCALNLTEEQIDHICNGVRAILKA